MTPMEHGLRRLARSLDTRAMEALASRGLLRRAQRDVARGADIQIVEETSTVLVMRVAEHEVRMPAAGPAAATCTCPAGGICQHVLACTIHLQRVVEGDSPESVNATDDDSRRDVLALSREQIEQWAGSSAYRAGVKFGEQVVAEVSSDTSVRVRFPSRNVEVHLAAGAALDGAIVTGSLADKAAHVVAAVLALQHTGGAAGTTTAQAEALAEAAGTPRSRAEILASCQALLSETLSNGLSRLTPTTQQRWMTLAMSAIGANLPRLAHLLRAVAAEVALAHARDANSDLARTLGRMAEVHALCAALDADGNAARGDLVGAHRTRYDEVGSLELLGAAAWPWCTPSGYNGLTVLFWEPFANRWSSWSESRPVARSTDFSARTRFEQDGPWSGASSPRQLARSAFRLVSARRNAEHRLSGSSASRVLVTGPSHFLDRGPKPLDDWSELHKRAASLSTPGLMKMNPLDAVFVVKPAEWGPREFDPVSQRLTWGLLDRESRTLRLELAFDELTAPAVRRLEQLEASQCSGALVVGRVQHTSRGLSLFPFTLHFADGTVSHVHVDDPLMQRASLAEGTQVTDAVADFDDDEEDMAEHSIGSTIGQMLHDVDDMLLSFAESGVSAVRHAHVERLGVAAARCERAGLTALAGMLRASSARTDAMAILKCVYLVHLHHRAAPASTAG